MVRYESEAQARLVTLINESPISVNLSQFIAASSHKIQACSLRLEAFFEHVI